LGSFSMLSGLPVDGNPGAPLDVSGTDEVLATFTVAQPVPVPTGPQPETLADAQELGTIAGAPTPTPGSLDLLATPGGYHLYRFELAPGHFWRVGAEVSAERDGGTLNAALALFDSQGQLLKFDDIGRNDDPNDPYLFAGLAAGTYYLGVSGSLNFPD